MLKYKLRDEVLKIFYFSNHCNLKFEFYFSNFHQRLQDLQQFPPVGGMPERDPWPSFATSVTRNQSSSNVPKNELFKINFKFCVVVVAVENTILTSILNSIT